MNFNLHRSNDQSRNNGGPQKLEINTHSYYQSDNPTVHLDWRQDFISQPLPVRATPTSSTPASIPEQGCLFRYEVLDECYQSRFWSRALEYYLLDNVPHSPPYRCLMTSCLQRDFRDPRDMLRHLKHCKLFPQGRFWCPMCYREETFKVVSKTECSWDRVGFAHKLFKKSWQAFQNISGHRVIEHKGPCPVCCPPQFPHFESPTTLLEPVELVETVPPLPELDNAASMSELPLKAGRETLSESPAPHDNNTRTPDSPTIPVSLPPKSEPASSSPFLEPPPSSAPLEPESGPEVRCPDCGFKPIGRRDSARAYLRKHIRQFHMQAIPCQHCDKSFTRREFVALHTRKAHPDQIMTKRREGQG